MLNITKEHKRLSWQKGKHMILLSEKEVKHFDDFASAENFLKKQKEMDQWIRVPINQLIVKPLPRNPVFLKTIMEEQEITSSEESTLSAMEDTNLLLSYPDESGKRNVIPLRTTSISSLKERAKLNGASLQKMPCEKTAFTLNCGLELWDEQSLLLVRDEKISAVHSGDEKDYSILCMQDLLKVLKDELDEKFFGYTTNGIEVDHEMLIASFYLPDKMLEDLNEILVKKQRKPLKGKPMLKFASSDVGICGANLYPYIENDRVCIRIGESLRLKHKNKASLEDFKENCGKIYSIFKGMEGIEKLRSLKIKHPYDCFLAVAKKCALPKKAVLEAAEDFDAFRPVECYAYDIYMGLWDVTKYVKTENESQLISLEENISRALALDYSSFDYKFSWM